MTKPILSFSKIQTYLRCPFLYYLVEKERWREGPTGPQAMGQTMHKTLEGFLSLPEGERSLNRLFEEFDRNWVNEGFKDTEETLGAHRRGKKLLEGFFKTGLPAPGTRVETEKRFSLDMGGYLLNGTVDRFEQTPSGKTRIVEYKTGARSWTDDRIANDEQMTLYALGAEKEWGAEDPDLAFLFLDPPGMKTTKRTSAQKQAAVEKAERVSKEILAENFKPVHDYCPRCEFNKRCPQVDPGLKTDNHA